MTHTVQKLITSVSFLVIWLIIWLLPVTIATASTLENPRTAFYFGITAFRQGDYALATTHFTEAIQQNPSDGAAYSNRCLSYLKLAAFQKAIEDCTQALQLNQNNPEAFLNRGLAYHRLNDAKNAIANFTRLLEIIPDDYRAYYNRGLTQIDQGNYRAAIDDFNQALAQAPLPDQAVMAEIYSDRGLAKLLLNQNQQAIADLSQAIRFNPTVNAFYNRGCAYHDQGDYRAALNDFTQVLQQEPNHAQAYLSRGMINHELGNHTGAIADLQQAADYFFEQGFMARYQQTLSVIKTLQKGQLSSVAIG
jgi:tetratricopeptide (TPR) repeat protein